MNEKEMIEIIKEIAECNKDSCKDCKSICNYYSAITLFCEKVLPEGSVVLSKEEYKSDFCSQYDKGYKYGSKETAKEIIEIIKEADGADLNYIAKEYGVEE